MAQSAPGRPSSTTSRNPLRGLGSGQHSTVYYLWLLLGLELVATWGLRHWSRHHHGG